MKTFVIFDNCGKTLDRFTIINKETGDIFGCSDNPDAPGGAGVLIGNCAAHRIALYGAGWRQRLPCKNVIKEEVDNYINNARLDQDWLGKEVDCALLPMNVKHYVARLASIGQAAGSSKANVVYMSKVPETVSSGTGLR